GHRHHRVLHGLPGLYAVVPPHEALQRMLPWCIRIKLVVVGKADEAMEAGIGLTMLNAADRETAAVRNRLAIGRQPDQASMIAAVINFHIKGHNILQSS